MILLSGVARRLGVFTIAGLVQAYSAESGELVWEDLVSAGNLFAASLALVAAGRPPKSHAREH